MRKVIKDLKTRADHKERMLGSTAPTEWLSKRTQDEWDIKEKYEIINLRRAARILESTL